ncbi:hypothetical protein PENCOP_c010G04819 [Penicillium coprophilum]|uniref:Uncharacterized protein n=1 Tax=Penicillium coprophilum TaxID=36646 RepID=A0A1V6UFP9_9EURO|nr:hypothetical protein PENCOP_c010G04819 [Penicillium coprophilum]
MAVLGSSKTGRRCRNSYLPILSRVIDIARLILVQKALWLDFTYGRIGHFHVLLYGPQSPGAAHVERLAYQFMIHGMHGPIETLLDWRRYGLKIHYNSTAPGHITWMGADQLYDDAARCKPGWSFLQKSCTPWQVDGQHRSYCQQVERT